MTYLRIEVGHSRGEFDVDCKVTDYSDVQEILDEIKEGCEEADVEFDDDLISVETNIDGAMWLCEEECSTTIVEVEEGKSYRIRVDGTNDWSLVKEENPDNFPVDLSDNINIVYVEDEIVDIFVKL